MHRHWMAALVAAAGFSYTVAIHAKDQVPDFGKLVKSTQNVGVLGRDLAGDATNFYTGGTSFSNVDFSVPGNNKLSVAVGRSYEVELEHMVAAHSGGKYVSIAETRQYAFGDWDLDIPRLQGTFTQQYGWQLNSTTPTKRCSVLGQVQSDGLPATGRPLKQTAPSIGIHGFWTGYTLHLPGDSQSLLKANDPSTPRPTTGGPYHWTTNKDWWVSCLSAAVNNAGEGFLAIGPDGTKYWFNHLSKRNVNPLMREIDAGGHIEVTATQRADVFMLPTRVEDRFGNSVTYTYSGESYAKLLTIVSSDGRQLTLTYNAQGFVETLTDGPRTVRYGYTNGRLTSVALPDNATWQYDFAALDQMVREDDSLVPPAQCYYPPYSGPGFDCSGWQRGVVKGSVTHPSGARVELTFSPHFHLVDPQGFAEYPMGISEKVISGPGIAAQKWYYVFSPAIGEARAQCQAGSCPTRIWADAISPDFRVTRRMFGVEQYADQGILLQELRGLLPVSTPVISQPGTNRISHTGRGSDIDIVDDASPVVLTGTTTTVTGAPEFYQETDYFYRIGTTVGVNPLRDTRNSQVFWSERRLPFSTTRTLIQGRRFNYQVNSWDGADRPLSVTRSSEPVP